LLFRRISRDLVCDQDTGLVAFVYSWQQSASTFPLPAHRISSESSNAGPGSRLFQADTAAGAVFPTFHPMQEVGAALQTPLICSMRGIELCYWWKTCLGGKMRLESFSAFARPVRPEAFISLLLQIRNLGLLWAGAYRKRDLLPLLRS
jgi:hypothetical protein